MVMLLSVYLLIAALITTGSAYGRGSGLFSLSSSADSSLTKMLALDQKGNRRHQNKSVLDSQTMERGLQSNVHHKKTESRNPARYCLLLLYNRNV